ncbi:MAG: 3'-5' exonuclease [Melioribacteraceae bacterium]
MIFGIFNKKKKQINHPEYWKKYLSYFENEQNLKIPISEANFVVIDVESNGLNPKRDKILSIGAVKIKNNQINISNSFEIFIEQEEFNPDTALVHGILKKNTLDKISEQNAVIELLEFIKNDIIIGHSIFFDISIINETIKHYGGNNILNKWIDTINLYKRSKGEDYKIDSSLSLDTLSDEFNIPKSDRHNAAGDALITAILFMKLTGRLKQRGITELANLLKKKRIIF